jgi:hypothetical protein
MLEENISKTVLEEAIADAINTASIINKTKKHKKTKISKKNNLALNKVVDDILSLKEGTRQAQQIRPIVSIEEWIGNEYYCGSEAFRLYPFWKDHLIRIFNSPIRINELILTGGLGTGKTTFANVVILREIYELSCYMNIPALFNLLPTSLMLFAYFNLNLQQANLTGFGQLKNMIDSSKYFQENFPRDVKNNSSINFTKANMMVRFASNEGHIIGSNLFGAILDEANFYKGDGQNTASLKVGEAQSQAKSMYSAIRRRGESRFTVDGENQSLSILVSSTMYDTSFTDERIRETEGDPHTYVINARQWDAKPKGTFPAERFYVFSGSSELDPFIITSKKELQTVFNTLKLDYTATDNIKEDIEHLPIQLSDKIIPIPVNYRESFNENIVKALQDIAGVSVAPEGRLFTNKKFYKEALYTNENPVFTKDEIVISTDSDLLPQDYIRPDYKPEQVNKKRYIHFDQSLSGDSYGVACTYIDDVIKDSTGLLILFLKVEWILRINPPKPPAKIDLAKVRSLIKYFEKTYGIQWGMISYDQFQSAEAIQELEKSGYNVRQQSVDRTDEPYLTLCQYIYDGRIEIPYNPIFEKELFGLVHYRAKHKVDHAGVGSSKDTADAVAGSIMNAIQDPNNLKEERMKTDLDILLNMH